MEVPAVAHSRREAKRNGAYAREAADTGSACAVAQPGGVRAMNHRPRPPETQARASTAVFLDREAESYNRGSFPDESTENCSLNAAFSE
jgi:hypothetical protein